MVEDLEIDLARQGQEAGLAVLAGEQRVVVAAVVAVGPSAV